MELDGKITIERWQALGLLSRFISKAEATHKSITQREFNEDQLKTLLIEYSNEKLYNNKFLREIFGQRLIRSDLYRLSIINFIKNSIFYNEITVTEWLLQRLVDYVNDKTPEDTGGLYSLGHTLPAHPWAPNPKRKKLSHTKWWLYHYDFLKNYSSDHKTSRQIQTKRGITRSLLTLYPFGKAVIISYSITTGDTETYLGGYDFHSSGQDYLLFKLRTADTNERDLHLLFYIGSGTTNIGIGQYHNFNEGIYSGNIILMKFPPDSTNETSEFIEFGADESKKTLIPSFVWRWFSAGMSNHIEVPKIKSISDLHKILNYDEDFDVTSFKE